MLHLSAGEPLRINPDEQVWNHAKAEVGSHPVKSKLDMETLILSVILSIQQKIELEKKACLDFPIPYMRKSTYRRKFEN